MTIFKWGIIVLFNYTNEIIQTYATINTIVFKSNNATYATIETNATIITTW